MYFTMVPNPGVCIGMCFKLGWTNGLILKSISAIEIAESSSFCRVRKRPYTELSFSHLKVNNETMML